jgi:hypothetical protein
MTPFVHCTTTIITYVEASSLRHFLKMFQAINMLVKLVSLSLISLMTIPLLPRVVPKCALTSYVIYFSHALLSRYSFGCTPIVGSSVILEISTKSICTGLSIHRMSPCTWETSYVKQILTFLPCPKCCMSNRFIILELYSLLIHCVGSNMVFPRGPIPPMFIISLSSANSRNLTTSRTSWSTYL